MWMKKEGDRCVCYIHCGNRLEGDRWRIRGIDYCNDCAVEMVNAIGYDNDKMNWEDE